MLSQQLLTEAHRLVNCLDPRKWHEALALLSKIIEAHENKQRTEILGHVKTLLERPGTRVNFTREPAPDLRATLGADSFTLGPLTITITEGPASLPDAERVQRLESAIRWALGENGTFPEEPEPIQCGTHKMRQRYYWRNELRKRAGLL